MDAFGGRFLGKKRPRELPGPVIKQESVWSSSSLHDIVERSRKRRQSSLLNFREAPEALGAPSTTHDEPGPAEALRSSSPYATPSVSKRLQGGPDSGFKPINAKAPLNVAVFATDADSVTGLQQPPDPGLAPRSALSPLPPPSPTAATASSTTPSTVSSTTSSIPVRQYFPNSSGKYLNAARLFVYRNLRNLELDLPQDPALADGDADADADADADEQFGLQDAIGTSPVPKMEEREEGGSRVAAALSWERQSESEFSESELSDDSTAENNDDNDIPPQAMQHAVRQEDDFDGDSADNQVTNLLDVETALQHALEKSSVWREIEPHLKRTWLTTYLLAKRSEQRAFLQLISLPKRNEVDPTWVDGVRRSNQRAFRVLMTIILHVVGDRSLCSPCQTRTPVKRGGCTVLPPETKRMRELWGLIGTQCTNCFYFPSTKPCEFSAPPTRPPRHNARPRSVKPTPVPIPLLGTTARQTWQLAEEDCPAKRPARPAVKPAVKSAVKRFSKTPVPLPAILQHPSLLPQSAAPSTGPNQAEDMSIVRYGEVARRPPRKVANQTVDATNGDVHRSGSRIGERGIGIKTPNVSFVDPAHNGFSSPGSSNIVGKALSLIGEISQLPDQEQSSVYQRMSEILEIARRPFTNDDISSENPASLAAADDWEIAPGRLSLAVSTRGNVKATPVAFSTPFLRREVVSFQQAQKISRSQKVLNKHVPALSVVKMDGPESGWECTLSVLEGSVRVKMPGLEGKVGQGGVVIITQGSECIITNIMHQESKVQIRWVKDE